MLIRRMTLLLTYLMIAATAAMAEDDAWAPYRALQGTWIGEGTGFGETSDVSHTWAFVLDGRFLRLTTVSTPRGEGDAVHEDVGYLSLDTDRGVFVFRHFLGEGFVNTFDMEVDGGTLDFTEVSSESAGDMQTRMRLVFTGDDTYTMELDLATPDKDFTTCQTMTMKRRQ